MCILVVDGAWDMVKVQVVLGDGLFLASIIELVYKIGKDDERIDRVQ